MFWSFIYILPYDLFSVTEFGVLGPIKVDYWHLVNIGKNPNQLLFQGTKVHLWFLMSLCWSIVIVAIFHRLLPRPEMPLMVFAIALYVFGLCAKAYSATPIGIHIYFNTRYGPFFSTVFFVIGLIMAKFEFGPRYLLYGLLIMIAGYLLHFGEIFYLYSTYNINLASHDYVVGTLLIGMGASFMALSGHPLLNFKVLSKIGKYTLGIYAIHFVFVDMLGHIDRYMSSPFWEIGYIFIVLALSVCVALLASKSKQLRMLFT